MTLKKIAILLTFAAATSACSGGGATGETAAACQATAECGGDLTGTWQIDSECLSIDSPFQQPECQGSIKDVSVDVTGTVTYAPNAADTTDATAGTQTSTLSYTFAASERYSTACLKALNFEGATADSCHGLEVLWAGAVSVSCTPVTDACECDFADAESPPTDSEDFTISGHQIVMPNSDPVDYCRTGTHLVESAATSSSRAVITLHLKAP
jgi:hypothetical protein